MPFPPAIVPVTVTGKIVSGSDGSTAAVGTVTFTMPGPLYDTSDNVLLSAVTYTATLDGTGSFSILLPPTNSPNVNPSNWSYSVRILTSPHSEYGAIQVPYNGGTVNFNSAYTPGLAASSGNTFVPASGGTMTGDLILSGSSTDLTVGGNLAVTGTSTLTGNVTVSGLLTGTFGGVTANYLELVASGLSTGICHGGEVNVNGSNPLAIDIAPFRGYIVDTITTPGSPALTRIVTTTTTTVALDAGALARLTTWFLMNSAGTISQQATRPTNTQRRTHLQLGAIVYDSGLNQIIIDQTLPVTQMNPLNQLYDLMYSLGTFNVSGNVISASAANLTFAKTAGVLFAPSFNYFAGATQTNDPHVSSVGAQNPVQFRHLTQSTTAPVSVVTALDVGNYDLNGVITAVGDGANAATIFRVYAVAANTATEQIYVQYGQAFYNSLAEAQAALHSESFTVHPSLTENAALIGYIVAIKTATNLTSTAQASFHRAGKFEQP